VGSDGTALDIDLVAASLRADRGDLPAFVEGLAGKLEDALPGMVEVQRRRSGLLGPKQPRSITIETEGERLELEVDHHGALLTRRAQVSGGIVLKREPLDIEPWLTRLGTVLVEQAERDQRTRQALERLLIG
jgi:hypothetical protein